MTDIQFRLILLTFVALLLVQVFYSTPKEKESFEKNKERRFGWLKRLSRFQLHIGLFITFLVIAGGITGIIGMFFFLKWAPVVYMISTLIAKLGSYFLFKGGKRSTLEKVLVHSVSMGEMLLLYIVFFGPAKEYFQ